jgi:hypothetical protein
MSVPETLSPHRFDEYLQAKYVDLVAAGHSATSAARKVGVAPATVRRHLQINQDFANAERQAAAEAIGLVEDTVFRLALGHKTPEQAAYDDAYRAYREEQDLPVEPPKPNPPSLKAAELILTRLDRSRWGSDATPSSVINVQNLITPEGAQDFHRQLLERRDALHPPTAPTAPTTSEVYDAEVVSSTP